MELACIAVQVRQASHPKRAQYMRPERAYEHRIKSQPFSNMREGRHRANHQ